MRPKHRRPPRAQQPKMSVFSFFPCSILIAWPSRDFASEPGLPVGRAFLPFVTQKSQPIDIIAESFETRARDVAEDTVEVPHRPPPVPRASDVKKTRNRNAGSVLRVIVFSPLFGYQVTFLVPRLLFSQWFGINPCLRTVTECLSCPVNPCGRLWHPILQASI